VLRQAQHERVVSELAFRVPITLSLSKGFPNLLPFLVLILLTLSLPACDADPESKAISARDTQADASLTEAPHVGHVAPDFLLQTLDGRDMQLSDYRGHIVFLNFWATWCGPCKIEMPAMEKLYREFRPKGFAVVAVSSDAEGAAVTRPYRDALGLSFTIALDPEMLVSRRYGVRSLPLTFLVNREGVITHQIFGARDWGESEARNGIRQLLRSP
jgi:peroxiredoxin